MQDAITMLSKFVPPRRLCRLAFSREYKYWVFNSMRKLWRLYNSGYKSAIEGVRIESSWELLPLITCTKAFNLKPAKNLRRFLKFATPTPKDMIWFLIHAIIKEDLGVFKEGFAKFREELEAYTYNARDYIFGNGLFRSKILGEAIQIIDIPLRNIFIGTGLVEVSSIFGRCKSRHFVNVFPFSNDLKLIIPLIEPVPNNIEISALLLLRNGGAEILTRFFRMQHKGRIFITKQTIQMMNYREKRWFLQFKYRLDPQTYEALVAYTIPKRNLKQFFYMPIIIGLFIP